MVIGLTGISGVALTVLLTALGFDEKLVEMVVFNVIPLFSVGISMS